MTKELHDIQAPIKLFRVAGLLQVSKDTIVEFLRARGYEVANKPVTELTEEMLQLVLERFHKDLSTAEKRREKAEKTFHRSALVKEPPAKGVEPIEPIPQLQEEIRPILSESLTTTTAVELAQHSVAEPRTVQELPDGIIEGIPVPEAVSVTTQVAEQEPPSAPEEVAELLQTTEKAPVAEEQPTLAAEELPEPAPSPEVPEPPHSPPPTSPPSEAVGAVERRREVISVTPEGTVITTSPGGLRVIGKIQLPAEAERRQARPRKPTRPEKAPSTPKSTGLVEARQQRRTEARPRKAEKEPVKKPAAPKPPQPSPLPSLPTPLSPTPPKPTKPPTLRRKLSLSDETTPKLRRRRILEEISQEEIEEAIRQTLIGLEETGLQLRGRLRQKRRAEREERRLQQEEALQQEANILRVTEFLTTAELAQLLEVSASEIISKCLQLGLMVSINQRLDRDTITLIAADYGYEVEFQDVEAAEELADEPDPPESLRPRPPIVTVMGHVDHGKTTLLDYVRQTNVVAGEAGGITQHIGAYQVSLPDGRLITFLDTPGHEAFTAMRARGAQVTDIVVLVVAADDAVMPQTVEAINHARAANVPIIVAINKVDKPEANPDRIRQQLADHGILVEEWGGRHQCVAISALTGKNVDVLLEKILLEAELLELKANPNRAARGTIIEAHLDKGKGAVATVVVQKGTLRVGDVFVAGLQYGRVRALYDERGHRLEAAPPSTPVQVAGFDGLPEVGDKLIVVEDERLARQIALHRQQLKREQQARRARHITLGDLAQRIQEGRSKELRVILKGDVMGSVEALTHALLRLSTDEVRVAIIHSGIGAITEADVMLAAASEAVIVGFQVQPTTAARKLAETEGVDIRAYRIIYECLDEIKRALEGLLSPEIKEEILGHAEVRQVFHISRIGTVAGCYVTDGVIQRNARVRVLRDGLPIHTGTVESLKRFKEDVREVNAGYECGLTVSNFDDFQQGDVIEVFRLLEQKRSLHV
ncbi:MAG: translation initiation factor IF-2 [Candidatus Kapabacteria bacterium]|nr:translation initiation factor IF-2 [Candidatus Kapabacteria bacterium]MDW7996915.1 translation initiation factor IF-2 [Bacteroidota bacterium]MDW8225753.1 translation initiation factor IF-2 [Bacteroidota bacterium]